MALPTDEHSNDREEELRAEYSSDDPSVLSNFYPLTRRPGGALAEGFWYSKSGAKEMPYPRATDTKVDKDFLDKLKRTIDLLKKDMIGELAVVDELSYCRLCLKENGFFEFAIEKDGQRFIFLEGIVHYYEEHNVQPSAEFKELIMGLALPPEMSPEWLDVYMLIRRTVQRQKLWNGLMSGMGGFRFV
jgi:hypothetical protein